MERRKVQYDFGANSKGLTKIFNNPLGYGLGDKIVTGLNGKRVFFWNQNNSFVTGYVADGAIVRVIGGCHFVGDLIYSNSKSRGNVFCNGRHSIDENEPRGNCKYNLLFLLLERNLNLSDKFVFVQLANHTNVTWVCASLSLIIRVIVTNKNSSGSPSVSLVPFHPSPIITLLANEAIFAFSTWNNSIWFSTTFDFVK